MKVIKLFLITVLLTSCYEEKEYCGIVVEKYRTSGGYKTNPQQHIVFYSDSLKRKIDVNVTTNSYANSQVGEKVCFNLTEQDLHN